LSFIKYSIISVLLVVLYFVWLEKNHFYNSFLNLKEQNNKLQTQIKLLDKELLTQKENIKKLKLQKQKKVIVYKQAKTKHKKVVKIILPKDNINYSQIIPKQKYDILQKDLKSTIEQKDDDIKITPSITFNEKKEVDAIKLDIKTKF
jgi:hypothetical protein